MDLYDPYESEGCNTLLVGLITPLITSIQAHLLGLSKNPYQLMSSPYFFRVFLCACLLIFAGFADRKLPPRGLFPLQRYCKVAQVWIWMPSQVRWVVLCSAWCGSPKFMRLSVGMVGNIKKYGEEMPKDDVLEKKGSSFSNMAILLSCTHLYRYPTISHVKGYVTITLSM